MRHRRRILMLASVLLLLTAGIPTAAPVGAVDGDPLRITESLTLSVDHHGWISIDANDVTLDCAGNSIIGSGPASGLPGVYVGHRTGVTIRNCIITDVNQGVALVGTTYSLIENNTIRNVRQGLILDVGSTENRILSNAVDNAFDFFGMLIVGESDENQVIGNLVERTPVAYLVNGTDGHTFEANIAEHNGSGFEFLDSHSNQITRNEARYHGRGFVLGQGASDNTVSDNVAEYGIAGFDLFDGAHHNTLTGNTSSGHETDEFAFNNAHWNTVVDNISDGARTGFTVWASDDNVIERNLVTGAQAEGIWLVQGSERNTVRANAISENGSPHVPWSAGIRVIEGSNDNAVIGNEVRGNFGSGIRIRSSDRTRVSGNEVVGNGPPTGQFTGGIHVGAGASDTMIVENEVISNDGWGIVLWGAGSSNRVAGNEASANTIDGILVFFAGGGTNIEDNEASGNGVSGIAAFFAPELLVLGNETNGNGQWGISTRSADGAASVYAENEACNNGWGDARDWADAASGLGTWLDNEFCEPLIQPQN